MYLLELQRVDEWLVALDVYYHVGVNVAVCFEAAVGAAAVGGGGHYHFTSEGFHRIGYPGVVGCDPYLVECERRPFVDTLDHGFSAEKGQRFAREARGCESGGNYADKLSISVEM